MQIELMEARTEIPEDEATVDRAELYKRFIDAVEKEKIKFKPGVTGRVRDD